MQTATTSPRPLPHPPWRAQPAYLRRIFREPQPVLDELSERYGPVVGLGAGPVRMAIVGDPAALKELFATSTDSFRWNHAFNVLEFVVGPGSMIVSDGTEHKRRRGSVQAAFSRRRLDGWIPLILDRTDAAIDRVAADGDHVRDLYVVGRELVLDLVVRVLFGERMAHRTAEIGALFQGPQDYLEAPAIRQIPHPIPGTTRARVRADRKALDRIIDAEIAERRARPSGDRLDVLEALVADGTLDDSEIRDQVVTLIGAGFDTTSASLAWLLWCATLADGVWDRLRAEADAVLGPIGSGAIPDASTLRALDLASRVVRETTRLHPAGVVSPRQAVVDLEIGGHRIPAGTLVLWSAHLAGRDPSAWDDPLRFDPERFVDLPPERRALADAAWVPFGRGARNCIGFALAQMELTLIASRLAQRLDVEPTAEVEPRPVGMVVNRPAGGAPMRVRPRA
ncbi:cytochrome P450 [Acidimicrobiia bacterium EGI L10123]|uniref:cytochrome P450 n=1 Tax=Salinilacustrithrix flava TaxID=2957203 RepID=UPI003D7C17FB|nr:cytochrome P450 [Acidimicrobiia bacterium EGI L10123]